jgi:hypothetical protein
LAEKIASSTFCTMSEAAMVSTKMVSGPAPRRTNGRNSERLKAHASAAPAAIAAAPCSTTLLECRATTYAA